MKNIAYIDHRFRELLSAITILDMVLSNKKIESENKNRIKIARDLLSTMLNETNYFVKNLILQEEEIMSMKNDFITNINHELKTPLTSIIGTTDFLLHYNNTLTKDDFIPRVERIKNSSEELLNLVQELLNLSKLESGQYPLNLDKIQIEEMLKHIERNFSPMFKEKKIDFHTIFTPSKKFESFINDSNHIYQIISNMLSNSLKFTNKGQVSLYIHTKNDLVMISVKDTGIGISEKTINLFLKKHNKNQKINKENKGIGLHIIKRLVEIHGGKIQIQSKKNIGSEFNVSIPINSKLYDSIKNNQYKKHI